MTHILTPRAQQALSLATKAAAQLGHSYVGTEHVLIGLIDLDSGIAKTLRAHGIDTAALRKRVVESTGGYSQTTEQVMKEAAKQVVADHLRTRRYYVLVDQGTQWFFKLASTTGKLNENGWLEGELTDLPSGLRDGPFLSNIYGRESLEKLLRFNGDSTSWGGWSISQAEHDRIEKLIALSPTAAEFQRLLSYP